MGFVWTDGQCISLTTLSLEDLFDLMDFFVVQYEAGDWKQYDNCEDVWDEIERRDWPFDPKTGLWQFGVFQ